MHLWRTSVWNSYMLYWRQILFNVQSWVLLKKKKKWCSLRRGGLCCALVDEGTCHQWVLVIKQKTQIKGKGTFLSWWEKIELDHCSFPQQRQWRKSPRLVWDKHQDNGISARESSDPSQQLGGHWHHLKRKREVEQEGWDSCQDSKNLYLFSIQCCASHSDSRKTASSLISCNQGPSSSHENNNNKRQNATRTLQIQEQNCL